jgi:hypothetical protein
LAFSKGVEDGGNFAQGRPEHSAPEISLEIGKFVGQKMSDK